MSLVLITLTNLTDNQLGPYGYGGMTIPATSSIQVSPPLDGLLCDNNFISDLLNQNVVPSIGTLPIPGGMAFQFFALLATADLSNTYANISGNATTSIKSGSGLLHAIIIGDNNTGGSITIYDNTTGSGTIIMSLSLGSPSGGLLSSAGAQGPVYLNTLNIRFSTGLTIVTSGSTNNSVTIIYQ